MEKSAVALSLCDWKTTLSTFKCVTLPPGGSTWSVTLYLASFRLAYYQNACTLSAGCILCTAIPYCVCQIAQYRSTHTVWNIVSHTAMYLAAKKKNPHKWDCSPKNLNYIFIYCNLMPFQTCANFFYRAHTQKDILTFFIQWKSVRSIAVLL